MKNIFKSFPDTILKGSWSRNKMICSIVIPLAVIVVAAVFILNSQSAFMMDAPVCGFEEHAHSVVCYGSALTCGETESSATLGSGTDLFDPAALGSQTDLGEEEDAHTHTDECYTDELTCELIEHTHVTECYPASTTTKSPGKGAMVGMMGIAGTGPSGTSLNPYLTGVVIKATNSSGIPTGPALDSSHTFLLNNNYWFEFSFAEDSSLLMFPDGVLSYYYNIPSGLSIAKVAGSVDGNTSRPIQINGKNMGTFIIHPTNCDCGCNGTNAWIAIAFDEDFDELRERWFKIDMTAQFKASSTPVELEFGDNIKITVDVQKEKSKGALSITKTSTPSTTSAQTTKDQKIKYNVVVRNTGPVALTIDTFEDIIAGRSGLTSGSGTSYAIPALSDLSDLITSVKITIGATDYTIDLTAGSPNAAGFSWTRSSSGQFTINFPDGVILAPNETINIEYTLNADKLITYASSRNPKWTGIVSPQEYAFHLTNTAKVKGHDHTYPLENGETAPVINAPPVSTTVRLQRTLLEKSGSFVGSYSHVAGAENKIKWTVKVGNGVDSLAGRTITETLGNNLTFAKKSTTAYDYDVVVTLKNASGGTVSSAVLPNYSSGSGATSFTYDVPTTDPAVTNVEFTIVTDINPNHGQAGGTTFENKVSISGRDGEVKGTVTIPVMPVPTPTIGVTKAGRINDAATDIEWTIDFSVSAGDWAAGSLYFRDVMTLSPNAITMPYLNSVKDVVVTYKNGSMSDFAPLSSDQGYIYTPPIGETSGRWYLFFGANPGSGKSTSDRIDASAYPFTTATQFRITYKTPLDTVLGDGTTTLKDFLRGGGTITNTARGYYGNNNYGEGTKTISWPVAKSGSVVSGNRINYTITITRTNGLSISNMINDTFDTNLEYIPGSFYITCGGATYGPYSTSGGDISGITGNSFSLNLDDFIRIKSSTDHSAHDTSAVTGWYNASTTSPITIYYSVRLKDDAPANPQTVVNTFSVGGFDKSSTNTVGSKVVTKTMSTPNANENTTAVEIIINPSGKKLVTNGTDTVIEVVDTMSSTLAFRFDTLKIYKKNSLSDPLWTDVTNSIAKNDTKDAWTYQTTSGQNATFYFPDETLIKIAYTASILIPLGGSDDIENTVAVTGGFTDTAKRNFTVSNANGAGGGVQEELVLYKYDGNIGMSKPLPNAKFNLYIGVNVDNNLSESTAITINGKRFYLWSTITTDASGYAPTITGLGYATVYALVETEAPEGYELNSTPKLFVFMSGLNGFSKSDAPQSYKDTKAWYDTNKDSLGIQILQGLAAGDKTLNVPNTPLKTNVTLGVSKAITGSPSAAEMPTGGFTFNLTQVANAAGGAFTTGTPITDTKNLSGIGKISFDQIRNLIAGTYYFEITEEDDAPAAIASLWEYDKTAHIIKVEVVYVKNTADRTKDKLEVTVTCVTCNNDACKITNSNIDYTVGFNNKYVGGPILPETGGKTSPFPAIGTTIMLLSAGGAYVFNKKSKARKSA